MSQTRSRRTHSRSRLGDRTRASRDSCFLSGSLSVNRSRSDGWRRSFCVRSAMVRSRLSDRLVVNLARLVRGRIELYRANFQDGMVSLIRREHALTKTGTGAVLAAFPFLPVGLAGHANGWVRAGFGSGVSRGNQRHDLAAIGERQVGTDPDQVAQIYRLLDANDANTFCEPTPHRTGAARIGVSVALR